MAAIWFAITAAPTTLFFGEVLVASVVADFALLMACLKESANKSPHPERASEPAPLNQLKGVWSSVWRYALCAGVMGFASEMSRELIGSGAPLGIDTTFTIATLASSLALIAIDRVAPNLPLRNLYGVLLVITVACFLLVPLMGQSAMFAVAAVSYLTFSVASILMVITSIEVAQYRGSTRPSCSACSSGSCICSRT